MRPREPTTEGTIFYKSVKLLAYFDDIDINNCAVYSEDSITKRNIWVWGS